MPRVYRKRKPVRRKKRTYTKKRTYNTIRRSKQLSVPFQTYRSKRTVSFEYANTNFNASGFLTIAPFITGVTFPSPPANTLPIVVNDFDHFKECFARYRISGASIRIQTTNQQSVNNDNITMVVAPLLATSQPATFNACLNLRSKLGPMSLGRSNATASGRKWFSRARVADYSWKYSSTSSTNTYRYATPPTFSVGDPQDKIRHWLPTIHMQTIDDNPPSNDWKMFIHFTIYTTYSVEK